MALFLLVQMPAARVIPDVISFDGGIVVCGAARHMASALFYALCQRGKHQVGSLMLRFRNQSIQGERAVFLVLFQQALEDQAWQAMLCRGGTQLDLYDHSCGSATLPVPWWLAEIVPETAAMGKSLTSLQIITGWGKSRELWQTSDVRASVLNLVDRCGIPCKVHRRNQGIVQVDLRG